MKKSKAPETHELDHWMDTLTKAEEIKADSEKMGHLQPHMKKKHAAMKKSISSLAELKKAAKMKMEGDAYDEDET